MESNFELKTDLSPITSSAEDNDCLVELIDQAETGRGGLDKNPAIEKALDQHVLVEVQDDEIELMCQRCPVQCTVKSVGGSALALVHNREECLDN